MLVKKQMLFIWQLFHENSFVLFPCGGGKQKKTFGKIMPRELVEKDLESVF